MAIDPNNLSTTATLTFDDEFNSFSMWNGSSGTWQTSYPWAPAMGGTNPANAEQEWYINPAYGPTSSVNPFSDSNGILNIQAAPASSTIKSLTGASYTSGIITTAPSFSQTYGYFEMRAELPVGQGIWPAFWLLPTDETWPPEIDVVETIGSQPTTLNTTIHSSSGGGDKATGFETQVPNVSQGFHTYGVDWEADFVTWYFDGQQVAKTATPAGMNKPMYMLANLAVGGSWPGSPNSSTPFPANMQIDYIRAYSAGASSSSTPPAASPAPAPAPAASTTPTPTPSTAPAASTTPTTSPAPTPAPSPTTNQSVQKLFELPASGAETNEIYGTARNNNLRGGSGNDFIDSWGGDDTMAGGAGDDTYVVWTSKNTITEAANAGVDTVLSGAPTFTLPSNVENLTLIGTKSVQATGNSLNNLMISNDYGSKLNGGAGNDILVAGKGADTLTGGAGSDEFRFSALPNAASHVTDFTVGQDSLDLRGIFGQIGYHGSDPIADHYLSFNSNSSGGTGVYVDRDGAGAAAPTLVATLDHVSPQSLQLNANVWAF